MSDDEFDADEALQEIDSLLAEISAEASLEDEHTLQTDSQTGATNDSPANSTAERILEILLADARLTICEIADRVGVSEPTVRKYINQLEEKDIIVGYSADLDPGELKHKTISLVRIEIDSTTVEDVTEALTAMEKVHSLFTLQESTEVIAKIQAGGFGELSEIIGDNILAIDGVETAHTTILEERHN